MKVSFSCHTCSFKITPEMSHAIEKQECPSCGAKLELGHASTVFLFIMTITQLKLQTKLSAEDIKKLTETFFKEKMKFPFPDLLIEEEPGDTMLRESKAQLKKGALILPAGVVPQPVEKTDEEIEAEEDAAIAAAKVAGKFKPAKDQAPTRAPVKKPSFVKVSAGEAAAVKQEMAAIPLGPGNTFNTAVAKGPKSDNLGTFLGTPSGGSTVPKFGETGGDGVAILDPAETMRNIAMYNPTLAAQMANTMKTASAGQKTGDTIFH